MDASGGMLAAAWEAHAEALVRAGVPAELEAALRRVAEAEAIDLALLPQAKVRAGRTPGGLPGAGR